MRTSFLRLVAFFFLMGSLCGWAQKSQKPAYSIDLTVTDKDSKEAIIMATIQLQPAGIVAVTNADGRATLHNIEAGTYTLNISYVGYEPRTTSITVNKNQIPNDPASPFVTSGVRIGMTSTAQRGLGEKEIIQIADIMAKVAAAPEDESVLAECRKETEELISRFPLYPAGAFDD